MNTGRVMISLALMGLTAGCASQQPAQQAILSADQLEQMIRVEVRAIEPMYTDTIIAANDQP